jgi:hypothetical protein
MADLSRVHSELVRRHHVEVAGPRQLDAHHVHDPSRPRGHDDDAVGEEHRLRDRVGDEDDGLARLAPDAEELDVHELAGHGVERAERLVHQQQRRVVDERAGQRHALAHAARQLVGVLVLEALEAGQLEQAEGAPARRLPVEAQHLYRQHHVVEDVPPRQQDGILEDDADVAAGAVDGPPAQVHAAGGARQEAGQDLEERGLAAARLAHDRDELALGDVERDAAERAHERAALRAIGLLEVRDDDQRSCHEGSILLDRGPADVVPSRPALG